MQILINNVLFGLVLSLASFEVGIFINRNTRIPILNPLLIAIGIIICFCLHFILILIHIIKVVNL